MNSEQKEEQKIDSELAHMYDVWDHNTGMPRPTKLFGCEKCIFGSGQHNCGREE